MLKNKDTKQTVQNVTKRCLGEGPGFHYTIYATFLQDERKKKGQARLFMEFYHALGFNLVMVTITTYNLRSVNVLTVGLGMKTQRQSSGAISFTATTGFSSFTPTPRIVP